MRYQKTWSNGSVSYEPCRQTLDERAQTKQELQKFLDFTSDKLKYPGARMVLDYADTSKFRIKETLGSRVIDDEKAILGKSLCAFFRLLHKKVCQYSTIEDYIASEKRSLSIETSVASGKKQHEWEQQISLTIKGTALPGKTMPKYHRYEEKELLRCLCRMAGRGEIPQPTYFIMNADHSVSVCYIFSDTLPASMEPQLRALCWVLAERFAELEEKLPKNFCSYQVDTRKVDQWRKTRLPGSYHVKGRSMVSFLPSPFTKQYTYHEMLDFLGETSYRSRYRIQNAKKKIARLRKIGRNSYEKWKTMPKFYDKGIRYERNPAMKRDRFIALRQLNQLLELSYTGYAFPSNRDVQDVFMILYQKAFPESERFQAFLACEKFATKVLSTSFLFAGSKGRRITNSEIIQRLGLAKDGSYQGVVYYHPTRTKKFRKEKQHNLRVKVARLVKAGLSCMEIAKNLGISLSNVKRKRIQIQRSGGFHCWAKKALLPI